MSSENEMKTSDTAETEDEVAKRVDMVFIDDHFPDLTPQDLIKVGGHVFSDHAVSAARSAAQDLRHSLSRKLEGVELGDQDVRIESADPDEFFETEEPKLIIRVIVHPDHVDEVKTHIAEEQQNGSPLSHGIVVSEYPLRFPGLNLFSPDD